MSDSKVKTLNGITERDGGYAVNFFATQPALNYGFEETTESYHIPAGDARLEPLKREIINIMKFWLDKGVAGFRVDLASSLIKNRTTGEALFSLWKYFIGTIRTQYPDCAFIAEWCNPGVAVGQSFFDCDFLLHECDEYNDLFRNEKGMNISPVYEKGYNYFSHNGQGNLDNFLKYTDELFLKLKDKGYFSVPSGNHDLIRLSKGKSFEELKVIFAFI